MTIVDKVISLLNANGAMPLSDIYAGLPEHTQASIRGNINRYLGNKDAVIRRVDRGVYSVIEIVRITEQESGEKSIDYTVSYYVGKQMLTYFHQGYLTNADIPSGIYQRMDNFPLFEDLEEHKQSLQGILAHADVRDILPKLRSDYFDLLVTDPPYRVTSGGNKSKGAPKGMLSSNDGRIFQFNDLAFSDWIPDAYRILKPGAQAYIFTNFLNLRALWEECEKAGFKIHNLLVWMKNTANPSRWYMSNREFILYLYKKGPGQPASITDCGSKAVHQFKNIIGDKLHETEKPVDLLRMYVKNSCKPAGWVIDPFGGSMSTMAACLMEQAKCFTCEIDEKYIMPGVNRIKALLQFGQDMAHTVLPA